MNSKIERYLFEGISYLPLNEKAKTLLLPLFMENVSEAGFNLYQKRYEKMIEEIQLDQLDFLKTGQYKSKNFKEVSRRVYDDSSYIEDFYIPFLYFSYFRSANYRFLFNYLTTISYPKESSILDVGAGAGAFLQVFSQLGSSLRLCGVEPSGPLHDHLLKNTSEMTKVETFLSLNEVIDQYDYVTCFEVLEHVESPESFLVNLENKIKRSTGRGFFSVAMNMESPDHINLYRRKEEVIKLFTDVGFSILECVLIPLGNTMTNKRADDLKKSVDHPSSLFLKVMRD